MAYRFRPFPVGCRFLHFVNVFVYVTNHNSSGFLELSEQHDRYEQSPRDSAGRRGDGRQLLKPIPKWKCKFTSHRPALSFPAFQFLGVQRIVVDPLSIRIRLTCTAHMWFADQLQSSSITEWKCIICTHLVWPMNTFSPF